MITVGEAKHIAKDWVEAEAPNIPNFRGVFLNGSLNFRNENDLLPPTSDVDLKVVVDFDTDDPIFERDLRHLNRTFKGITLETTFSPFEEFSTPERVLADFAYAAHFSVPNILSDPSGKLSKIHIAVEKQFSQKKWVVKRIEAARDFAVEFLDSLGTGSLVDRMLALLYALGGGIVQIPIQADLRPPTVRKACIVHLEIMKNQGRLDLHESMLKIYGSQSIGRVDVERHFQDLSTTFDRAVGIVRSPSFGDLVSPLARPVVIDGSREMMKDGFHREALNWIVSMRTVCQQTILQDAPKEEQKHYSEQYKKLLAELGFHSMDDFQKRAEDGKQLLEEVMQVAEQIMAANEKTIH